MTEMLLQLRSTGTTNQKARQSSSTSLKAKRLFLKTITALEQLDIRLRMISTVIIVVKKGMMARAVMLALNVTRTTTMEVVEVVIALTINVIAVVAVVIALMISVTITVEVVIGSMISEIVTVAVVNTLMINAIVTVAVVIALTINAIVTVAVGIALTITTAIANVAVGIILAIALIATVATNTEADINNLVLLNVLSIP